MATDDFFRARLDGMVDLRHPLAVLASRMPWSQIESALAPAFAHKDRKGRTVEGADMFGPTLSVAGHRIHPRAASVVSAVGGVRDLSRHRIDKQQAKDDEDRQENSQDIELAS
jgi:hypothetical protein